MSLFAPIIKLHSLHITGVLSLYMGTFTPTWPHFATNSFFFIFGFHTWKKVECLSLMYKQRKETGNNIKKANRQRKWKEKQKALERKQERLGKVKKTYQ